MGPKLSPQGLCLFDPDSWSVAHGKLSVHVCSVNKQRADIRQCHWFYLSSFSSLGLSFSTSEVGGWDLEVHLRLLPSSQRFILDSLPSLSFFSPLLPPLLTFYFSISAPFRLSPQPVPPGETSSWFADSCLPFGPHMAGREHGVPSSSYKATSRITGALPSWPHVNFTIS